LRKSRKGTALMALSEREIQMRAYFRFAIPTLILVPIYAYFRNDSMREAIQLVLFILLFNAFASIVYCLVDGSKNKSKH
jgi:hypothetical protein